MRRHALLIGLFVIFAPAPAYAGKAPADCDPPERTNLIWQRTELQFVILGEFHGTAEIPAAFGEMVCSALATGREVLVGLEYPETTRPAFEAYLNSPGSDADRAGLIEAVFVQEYKNGLTSRAVFATVERFRQWRQAGRPLAITAFQRKVEYDPAEGQTPHEMGMAASLLEAAAQNPDALVLVLVGNLHARKMRWESEDGYPAFEPMAMHLPPSRTLALVAVHEGGEAWNCRYKADGAIGCGRHIQKPTVLGRDAPPGLKLGLEPGTAYDGFVKLGTVTASPPMKPSGEQ